MDQEEPITEEQKVIRRKKLERAREGLSRENATTALEKKDAFPCPRPRSGTLSEKKNLNHRHYMGRDRKAAIIRRDTSSSQLS